MSGVRSDRQPCFACHGIGDFAPCADEPLERPTLICAECGGSGYEPSDGSDVRSERGWIKTLVDSRWPWQIVDSMNDLVDRAEAAEVEVRQLREALRETLGWSYGEDMTPERRDELERLIASDITALPSRGAAMSDVRSEADLLGILRNPPDDLILAVVRASFDPHINGPNTIQRNTAINDMRAIADWLEALPSESDPS